MNRDELRNRVKATKTTDGHAALRDYLLFLAEEKKEALLTSRGQAADELRGYIKILRGALREVDVEQVPRERSNVYV